MEFSALVLTCTEDPGRSLASIDSFTWISTSCCRTSSMRSKGVPGVAIAPASTNFAVTTPAKGAVMTVNAWFAWDWVAADCAACTCAAAA